MKRGGEKTAKWAAVIDRRYSIALALCVLVCGGCGPKEPPPLNWEAFSGMRAYAHVERQVAYGPRPSGSVALGRTATYITSQFQEYGLSSDEQIFVGATPRGAIQFRNIVAKTPRQSGAPKSVIVIGAHYDTKLMPEIKMVGANDAGSGVGALLEIARVAAAQPDLWFVVFDGEECIVEYGPNDGLWGSKFFVKSLGEAGKLQQIKAMILLDMVGDANLNITMPVNSTSSLVQRVFDAARELGYRDHFSFRDSEILDDHVPFLRAGIPAVNLIDFEYGSATGLNDYWHTEKDTLDKVSPRSLEIVGRTVVRLLAMLQNDELTR